MEVGRKKTLIEEAAPQADVISENTFLRIVPQLERPVSHRISTFSMLLAASEICCKNLKFLITDNHSDRRMTNPKLESRKAANIAYIEHFGPYDQVPWENYIQRLYGWAKKQKVMPGFYPMGIYHDDPEKTSSEKCRSEIAITFKGKAKEENGIKTRRLQVMKVAAISHKAPGNEFKNTYAKLRKWINEKGYEVSGPPIEVYTKKPKVVGDVTVLYAKVMMPVKKK